MENIQTHIVNLNGSLEVLKEATRQFDIRLQNIEARPGTGKTLRPLSKEYLYTADSITAKDGASWFIHREKLLDLKRLMCLNNKEFIKLIKTSFASNAAAIVNNVSIQTFLDSEDQDSDIQYLNSLEALFVSRADKKLSRLGFRLIKQTSGESITTYYSRVIFNYCRAYDKNQQDALQSLEVKDKFIDGLNNNTTKRELLKYEDKPLTEILAMANHLTGIDIQMRGNINQSNIELPFLPTQSTYSTNAENNGSSPMDIGAMSNTTGYQQQNKRVSRAPPLRATWNNQNRFNRNDARFPSNDARFPSKAPFFQNNNTTTSAYNNSFFRPRTITNYNNNNRNYNNGYNSSNGATFVRQPMGSASRNWRAGLPKTGNNRSTQYGGRNFRRGTMRSNNPSRPPYNNSNYNGRRLHAIMETENEDTSGQQTEELDHVEKNNDNEENNPDEQEFQQNNDEDFPPVEENYDNEDEYYGYFLE